MTNVLVYVKPDEVLTVDTETGEILRRISGCHRDLLVSQALFYCQNAGEEETRYLFVDGGCENTEKAEFFNFNIDAYRYGSVFVPDSTYKIRKEDRLAQAVIKPGEAAVFTEVDALGDSNRGAGGFGSSGVVFDQK